MTKLKKRATALLLGAVTFFMALAMPYNTTRVYAADVAFSWVVNQSSNTILNWILLYLGISVAPEAISEGKVFDKTGQFAMDFCNEFFGDTFEQWYVSNGFSEDIDTFKREFNDILTQEFDAAKYVAGDIKSGVLDTLYKYLYSNKVYTKKNYNFKFDDICIKEGSSLSISDSFDVYGIKNGSDFHKSVPFNVNIEMTSGFAIPMFLVQCYDDTIDYQYVLVSNRYFRYKLNGEDCESTSVSDTYHVSYGHIANGFIYCDFDNILCHVNCPYVVGNIHFWSYYEYIFNRIFGGTSVTDITYDIPDVAGKDYAYDLVGWPNAWDIDKPDVKPWDNVDSLPIPGDIAIPKEIPGVTDLPGIMDGVIGGTIPWPDIIDIIKDLPVDPTPDPDKPTEPDPDPELPEIPAVLPQGVSDKLKDLSGKFPFCIPFDLVDCFKSFGSNEAAEAPKWDFTFKIPGTNKDYEFSVDLSMFDKYIPIFRSGVLILFLIGLIIGTRKLIGWQVKN